MVTLWDQWKTITILKNHLMEGQITTHDTFSHFDNYFLVFYCKINEKDSVL